MTTTAVQYAAFIWFGIGAVLLALYLWWYAESLGSWAQGNDRHVRFCMHRMSQIATAGTWWAGATAIIVALGWVASW